MRTHKAQKNVHTRKVSGRRENKGSIKLTNKGIIFSSKNLPRTREQIQHVLSRFPHNFRLNAEGNQPPLYGSHNQVQTESDQHRGDDNQQCSAEGYGCDPEL
jgi:hypothetical protein